MQDILIYSTTTTNSNLSWMGSISTLSSPPLNINSNTPSTSIHSSTIVVYMLSCIDCHSPICKRAMKAVLLGDSRVALFSTDIHPGPDSIAMISNTYHTTSCDCLIRDFACLHCGNSIGYRVKRPCQQCLRACNNGHFYIFSADKVTSFERYLNDKILTWSNVPSADIDLEPVDKYLDYCR